MFAFLFSFFTLPDAATTMASTTEYSSVMFDELLPVLYIVAGILIGGMIVAKLISTTIKGAKKVVGGGGKGRRR
jgi:hypothetical protein